jgi:hypothetical protein
MRTYEAALAASRDDPPFSNSTEGYAWTDRWCDTCVHEAGIRDGTDPTGCPLLLLSIIGRTPIEWTRQRGEDGGLPRLDDAYHCAEYKPEGQ